MDVESSATHSHTQQFITSSDPTLIDGLQITADSQTIICKLRINPGTNYVSALMSLPNGCRGFCRQIKDRWSIRPQVIQISRYLVRFSSFAYSTWLQADIPLNVMISGVYENVSKTTDRLQC